MTTATREFRLRRTTAGDLHMAPEILQFFADHGGEHLPSRTLEDIERHLAFGEAVLLFEMTRLKRLVGVGLASVSDDDMPVIEIADTIVHPELRGVRVALILGAGALMAQLINIDLVSALIFMVSPKNPAGLAAASRSGSFVEDAKQFEGSMSAVDVFIAEGRARFSRHPDNLEPKLGVLLSEVIGQAARTWLAMNEEGHPFDEGRSQVFLDGDWCCPNDPEREDVARHVRVLAQIY